MWHPTLAVGNLAKLRPCLVGFLPGSGSGSSGGALPDVLYEEPFFSEKQRSPSGGVLPNTL